MYIKSLCVQFLKVMSMSYTKYFTLQKYSARRALQKLPLRPTFYHIKFTKSIFRFDVRDLINRLN